MTFGIYRATGEYQQDYGHVSALMFLATLPILVFYGKPWPLAEVAR
ncbi:hypothetical protein [Streptomyces coerulescens]|uniref:Uncharacterized protein n=1 Tax=Streptomyces coerulescens TaxID=29304 RepID=A0ABW0CV87_STRCD|nr:hypothetical protein POD33_00020 [Streptomyces moderatus]